MTEWKWKRAIRPALAAAALAVVSTTAAAQSEMPVPHLELHMAAWSGDEYAVRRLLEDGADPNSVDEDGRTPLHYAAGNAEFAVIAGEFGHAGVARALLEWRADPNAKDDESGATPLHWTAWSGNTGVAVVLLVNGADPNIRNWNGTPLDLAIEYGNNGVEWLMRVVGADGA